MSRLDRIIIAAPCPLSWEAMEGDDTTRFCSACSKNVYNISDMTQKEAEKFLSSSTGKACLRIFRRVDGKVMTDNCPRGLRVLRNRARAIWSVAAGVFACVFGFVPPKTQGQDLPQKSQTKSGTMNEKALHGKIAIPATKSQQLELRGDYVDQALIKPAPAMLLGEATVVGPTSNKKIILPGDECGANNAPANRAPVIDKSKEKGPLSLDRRADYSVYQLYMQAKAADEKDQYLLAQTYYLQAIELAKTKTTVDPALVEMVKNALNNLRIRSGLR